MQKGDLIQARIAADVGGVRRGLGRLADQKFDPVEGAFGIIIRKNDELCAPFADVYDVLWNDGTITEHWENDLVKINEKG